MKIVAFDLETTGLDPEKDRILEFCFMELDQELNEKGRWTRLVNPGIPIPQETIDIHGITDDMVEGEPPFSTHAARIEKLIEGATLLGHNVRFDIGFLHAELVRAGRQGLDVNHPHMDTAQVERMVNSHRLGACYKRYTGQDLDDAHRSEADTAATVDVLRGQLRDHGDVLPSQISDLTSRALHRHFNPDAVSRQYLDHGRKFYELDGKPHFAFGKFRDQAIDSNNGDHTSYLAWMKDRDFAPDTKQVAARLHAEAVGGQTTL